VWQSLQPPTVTRYLPRATWASGPVSPASATPDVAASVAMPATQARIVAVIRIVFTLTPPLIFAGEQCATTPSVALLNAR
jgi:hypothetical protein